MIEQLIETARQGTVIFLGLLCFIVFSLNAVLLTYLLIKRGVLGLAKCPKCGRVIACPHCEEDDGQG